MSYLKMIKICANYFTQNNKYMGFSDYRKESSERSDNQNWAKQSLINNTVYHFDSIEGCNQNTNNVVTHLIERARVYYNDTTTDSDDVVLQNIINLEGSETLLRKINFASTFGLNLSYTLYSDEYSIVWLYDISSISSCRFVQIFKTYGDFSKWISTIKGWSSSKPFREKDDLPHFDKELRRLGTAWPTNIDCFISNSENIPIAILEFQNAKDTSVAGHCNNEYFLCKQVYTNAFGFPTYRDDIRRWMSQEILRVQSNLRLFVITWSQNESDFILKEIELITFPNLPYQQNWNLTNQYKAALHKFVNARTQANAFEIASKYSTLNLKYHGMSMQVIINNPPLSTKDKTFPLIYYSYKQLIKGEREELPNLFKSLIEA